MTIEKPTNLVDLLIWQLVNFLKTGRVAYAVHVTALIAGSTPIIFVAVTTWPSFLTSGIAWLGLSLPILMVISSMIHLRYHSVKRHLERVRPDQSAYAGLDE